MHEVAIALSLLKMVENKCQEVGYSSVESVKIRVGKASGVLPEAMQFAFEAVKRDSLAKNAQLVIDLVPAIGFCKACSSRFEWEAPYALECPLCKSTSFQVFSGREMELVEIEVL